MHSLDELNRCSPDDFVKRLGAVYEHSPWVAERAAATRPYASIDALHAAMQRAVTEAGEPAQWQLIRAHPELLGKLAPQAQLTAESRGEQAAAGLDQCSAQELEQLAALNKAYREKFGFPFIVAVRGLTRAEIIARLSARLHGNAASEFATNLTEISKIARLRLAAMITS